MTLVAIGENNIPIATFAVSCNKKRTPLGTHSTAERYRWHELYGNNNYGQYCVRYGKKVLLHSVLYSEMYNPLSLKTFTNKNGWTYNTYNGIIQQLESGGCIRLRVIDAKWLYDNLKLHTPFYIIDTNENIDRPKYDIIPIDSLCDPTDIKLAELTAKGYNLPQIIYENQIES